MNARLATLVFAAALTAAAPAAQSQERKPSRPPEYRLDVTLPDGLDEGDFFATFPTAAPGWPLLFHRTLAEDPKSPMALIYGRHTGAAAAKMRRAPLQPGDPPTVRFGALQMATLAVLKARDGSYELQLRSEDGRWAGSASVTSLEGLYPEAVPIKLSQRGLLEVQARDPVDESVPTAWVRVTRTGEEREVVREAGVDRAGRVSFRWLAPGDYRVEVDTLRYDAWSKSVSVVAGSAADVDARLASSVELGPVSGFIRSRTGKHRSKGGQLVLTRPGDPRFTLIHSFRYRKRDGAYVGAFAFENIPAGPYALTIGPMDNRRWKTLRLDVTAPVEELEFLCEDDVATYDLDFRALDAETGAAIERTWEIAWLGDPSHDRRLDDDYESGLYKGVPEGVPVHWLVRAKGYRLARGDRSAFQAEGDLRVVEARLVRGWGDLFHVTTRERDPLAGVELIADGTSIGRTDAGGYVTLDLDAKPRSLDFRLDGWHVSWGSVDPADEGFGWGPETPVYLSRDE